MLTWHVISVVILSLELFFLIKLKAYQIGMLLVVSTGVGVAFWQCGLEGMNILLLRRYSRVL